jgi:hypothetical protein
MKYDFFWVFPLRLSNNSRRFGTLYRYRVPKGRLLALRRRGNTEKKPYFIWELFCSAFLNKHLTNNGVLAVYTQML